MKEFINASGNYATATYLTFFPDFQSMPSAQPFLKKYRARYGTEGPYSVYGYEAINVLFQAIQEAGTTDAEAVAKVLRAHPYDTCLGKVEFDEKGDPKKSNFIIWKIENGKFIPN
ncbi:MAG: ABC transporter substrate-binding protein [Verrucomicrobiia bacterium]